MNLSPRSTISFRSHSSLYTYHALHIVLLQHKLHKNVIRKTFWKQHNNKDAITAGLLNPSEKFLKPLLTSFLESSPCGVVLEYCCVNDNERMEIINASQKEMGKIKNSESEAKSNEDMLLIKILLLTHSMIVYNNNNSKILVYSTNAR